ncbi:hypothetical protein [Petrotoga olearia]|uniref:ABC transporter permease n=2 Tax=Petrotoga olearia TaxID=156203 RepID=A0A2K1P4T4_9BACT|nr:hypothetical protein [Petrotoga olearia]PNR97717.1 hypothetical protein X929_01840 [Petrotoga olearia DSM 13574]RMA75252.1 hypothetical protein C8D75_0770 [Petrotoga olearia]
MKKIMKYNFRMLLTSFVNFYFPAILLIAIITFILYSFVSSGPNEAAELIFNRMLILMAISMYTMGAYMILNNLVIPEKTTGRIELLLSNGFEIQPYLYSSIIVGWIVMEVELVLMFIIPNIITSTFLEKSFFTGSLFKIIIFVSVFGFGLLSIMYYLIFRIKRISIINNLFFIIGFIVIFGGSYLTSSFPVTEQFNDILLWILLGVGIFLFFFTVIAGRKITKETVVLTIPD